MLVKNEGFEWVFTAATDAERIALEGQCPPMMWSWRTAYSIAVDPEFGAVIVMSLRARRVEVRSDQPS